MDGDGDPGVSLFQGNDVVGGGRIELNGSLQRQEEEEAIEDDRRRNEEIRNALSAAFDDLSIGEDDDDDDEDDEPQYVDYEEEEKRNIVTNNFNRSHLVNGNIHGTSDEYQSSNKYHENGIDSSYGVQIGGNLRSILKNSSGSTGKDESSHRKQRYLYTLPGADKSVSKEMVEEASNGERPSSDGNKRRLSSPHLTHCYQRTSSPHLLRDSPQLTPTSDRGHLEKQQRNAYLATRYNSVEQLQMLYEVSQREIISLKDQLEKETSNSISLKDDLTRKLMLAEADKEGALLSYKQTSELLAWSKGKASELEREVATLKQNIVNLEKSRSENVKELEVARGMITELQQRLAFLERSDGSKQTERQLESAIKELQRKHLQEITSLNKQLESYEVKLKQKDVNIKSSEERLLDLQGKLGSLMVEKSETITALMRDLDESQAQCHQLMASNISCENVRLQQRIDDLLKEKEECNKDMLSLKAECDMLRTDLEQLESASKFGFSPGAMCDSDSIVQLGLTSKNGSSDGNTQRSDSNLYLSDTNNKLKDELHRALLGQRAKRNEISRLKEKLSKKENQIAEMKKQERIYQAEVENLKDGISKVMSELKTNRNHLTVVSKNDAEVQTLFDINALQLELQNEKKRNVELENEKEILKQQFADTEKLLKDVQDKLLINNKDKKNEEQFEKQLKDQLVAKDLEYRVVLEQKNKECDKLKELYIELRQSKETIIKQLENEKDSNNNLNLQLKTLMTQIDDYKSRIDVKDELLTKYKNDCQQLEAELSKLKNESDLSSSINFYIDQVSKKEKECDTLKSELNSARKQYADELERLKMELEAAKKRLIELEKNLRVEFTNKMNNKEAEISSLHSVIQDKDIKLKEAVTELNTYSNLNKDKNKVMTDLRNKTVEETENRIRKENELKLQQLIEQHSKELNTQKIFYESRIDSLEKIHKEAIDTVVNKTSNEFKRLEEKYQTVISSLKKQLAEQEESMRVKYLSDLALAEEKVKDVTVKYFAEEIRKMEVHHKNQLAAITTQSKLSPSVIGLQKLLNEKEKELEQLKSLKPKYLEAEEKLAALEKQIDIDRESTAELVVRWAKEVQDLYSEMLTKQNKMTEMNEKLKKMKKAALYFKTELKKQKENASHPATTFKDKQYSLLQHIQDRIMHAFEADNKNQLELEEKYALKEQELRLKLNNNS